MLNRSIILWQAPASSLAAGGVVRRGYYLAAGYFSFMLITYPIAWACAEGGNVITVTSEMIWYGILDILAGPVFFGLFLWDLRGVDYNSSGLHSGKFVAHETAGVSRLGAGRHTLNPSSPGPHTAHLILPFMSRSQS